MTLHLTKPLKLEPGFGREIFRSAAKGGIETSRGNLKYSKMADGTIISYRQVSKSDGTSVVEINIRYSTNAGGLKYQKIHFTEGDK